MPRVALPNMTVNVTAQTVGDLKSHLSTHHGVDRHAMQVFLPQQSVWDRFDKDPTGPSELAVVVLGARRFPLSMCPYQGDSGYGMYQARDWGLDGACLVDMAMYSLRRGFASMHAFLSHLQPGTSATLFKHVGVIRMQQQRGWLFRNTGSCALHSDGWLLMRWWLADVSTVCWYCPYQSKIALFVPLGADTSASAELRRLFARSVFYWRITQGHGGSMQTPFSAAQHPNDLPTIAGFRVDPACERALWTIRIQSWCDTYPSAVSALRHWSVRMRRRSRVPKRARLVTAAACAPC